MPCQKYLAQMRQKIASIISRGGGIEDPDAPGVLQETQYWCTVKTTKTDQYEMSVKDRLTVDVRASAGMVDQILCGPTGDNIGSVLENGAAPKPTACLSGDVLAAFNKHNEEIAAIANVGRKP